MPGPTKPTYAPIPARAVGDRNLTAEELRVLGVVAIHDRMGANGIGCYASHPRLAEMAGCHIKSLSRSLRVLAERGYITGDQHPLNHRLRVYRVVYTEFDKLFLKSAAPAKGNTAATGLEPIGNKTALENTPIGNKDCRKTVQDHGVTDVNIFSETGIHPAEAVGIHPVETASPRSPPRKGALEKEPGKSVGAMLAMFERCVTDRRIKAGDRSAWLRFLDGLAGADASLDTNDPAYGRARRLLEEYGDWLAAA